MKIAREALLAHLDGIYCGGLIPQAAFSGAFATAARSANRAMAVFTEGLDIEGELEEPIGIGASDAQFRTLIAQLRACKDDTVQVHVSNQRLMIAVGNQHGAFLTTDPEVVTQRIPDAQVDAIRAEAEQAGEKYPLPMETVGTLLAQQKARKAEDVKLILGPKESGVRLGSTTQDQWQTPLPGLTSEEAGQYLMPPQAFVAVLEQVTDGAELWVAGDEVKMLVVQNGPRLYLLTLKDVE